MAKTTFILKEPRSKTDTLIFLIFRYGNNRVKISTNEKIIPKYWNKEIHRVRETKNLPYAAFNQRLKDNEETAMDVYRKFLNDHDRQQPTVERLRELIADALFPTATNYEKGFFGYAAKFVEEAKTRINEKKIGRAHV